MSLLRKEIIQNLRTDAYERIWTLALDRKFCELTRNFGSLVESCIIWEINLETSRAWGLVFINLNRRGPVACNRYLRIGSLSSSFVSREKKTQ
jgi:hypothetical protein